ncbi:hypothetical protein [Nocardia sp. alder85J]|uniref:DUF7373 family lipoprotein n=1 Tax=Nocardia sp. alder85J TaxID=2862949 RepID=UPI001CD36DC9|nr:hypothetical protein [Nocardia sp. alder85J]MCX4096238.1 hypothetical protein [Nocardia sp. alder85J]
MQPAGHRTRTVLACATAVAVLITGAACGGHENTAAGPPIIDVSKIDSGNYPGTPVDIEKTRTDDSGYVREAIRIGGVVPLAMDVDSRFIYEPHPSYARNLAAKNHPVYFGIGVDDNFNAVAPGLVVGWTTTGQRRLDSSMGRVLNMDTLRFTDADHAAAAVKNMSSQVPSRPVTLTGYPAATAIVTQNSVGYNILTVWCLRNDLLLILQLVDPVSIPFDVAPLADIAKNALDKWNSAIAGYSETPADKFAALPLDVDGMLSRTLPFDKDAPPGGMDPEGVYPRQAALHSANRPDLVKAAFDDAGVDEMSAAATQIYRTRDAAAATRLAAALAKEHDDVWVPMDGPPNMPGVHCFKQPDSKDTDWNAPPTCFAIYDRYVAAVDSLNIQELYQRTAAQYKLLAYGHGGK